MSFEATQWAIKEPRGVVVSLALAVGLFVVGEAGKEASLDDKPVFALLYGLVLICLIACASARTKVRVTRRRLIINGTGRRFEWPLQDVETIRAGAKVPRLATWRFRFLGARHLRDSDDNHYFLGRGDVVEIVVRDVSIFVATRKPAALIEAIGGRAVDPVAAR